MGMFRPAVNELGFSTSSTERIRIDSAGNVGIGTTNPSAKLDINNGNSPVDLQLTETSTAFHKLGIRKEGAKLKLVEFNNDGTAVVENLLTADASSGTVGIGTSSPESKLHLENSVGFDDDFDLKVTIGSQSEDTVRGGKAWKWEHGVEGDGYGYNYTFKNTKRLSTSGYDDVMTLTSAGNVGIGTNAPQGPLHLKNSDSNACRIYLENAASTSPIHSSIYSVGDDIQIDAGINLPGIRLADTGNVGIGTANPLGKLSIEGSTASNYNTHIVFNNTAGTKDFAIGAGIQGNTNNGFAVINKSDDSALLYIADDGNVGIGTTNPNRTFEVAGNIRATKRSVDGGDIALDLNVGGSADHPVLNIYDKDGNAWLSATGGSVGIGTTSPSAPLEVSSTTGGVIMPRMNNAQMLAITSPTPGEMVFNTTDGKFYGYDGTNWVALH